MSTEKLKGVSSLSQVKLTGADSKKLEGLKAQSKDTVLVSGKTSMGQTKNLNESAKIIKFSNSLNQLTTKLRSLQSEKDDLYYYTDTIAPIKLEGSTKKDVLRALTNDLQILPSDFVADAGVSIDDRKQVLPDFKELMAQTIDFDRANFYVSNVREALAIIDKIEQLFKNNNNLSKIICVTSS